MKLTVNYSTIQGFKAIDSDTFQGNVDSAVKFAVEQIKNKDRAFDVYTFTVSDGKKHYSFARGGKMINI